jgi:hypothetical protein
MATYRTALVLCTLSFASLYTEAFPPLTAASEQLEKFNSGDVSFDYPDNWRVNAVVLPTVALLSRGDDLSLTIVRSDFEFPQTFNEVFAQYEADAIRKQYPDAAEFSSRAVMHKTVGQMLQVDFVRPKGTNPSRAGRPMRVRVYAVPAGRSVYRIICLARADEFARRHEPVFIRMMDSLVITPPQSDVMPATP